MKKKINIEYVISQRLNLQSVQRNIFNKYDILFPKLEKFKREEFLDSFVKWTDDQQSQFLIEVGGQVNLKLTRAWINSLIKNKTQTKQYETTV